MAKYKDECKVLYDDNHVLGLLKPSGWLSQGDKTGDRTVMDWAKKYIKEKENKPGNVYLGCVHRLDRPSSGVMVYAKTSKALKRLNSAFAERRTKKKYVAVVEGNPPKFQDRLVHYLRKNRKRNYVNAYQKKKSKTRKAILDYQMIGQLGDHYLLDVSLETGRPHQIRTQLASAGFPIVGDLKYGAQKSLPYADIALHCYDLTVDHPTIKEDVHLHHLPYDKKPWEQFTSIMEQQL